MGVGGLNQPPTCKAGFTSMMEDYLPEFQEDYMVKTPKPVRKESKKLELEYKKSKSTPRGKVVLKGLDKKPHKKLLNMQASDILKRKKKDG